MCNSVAHAMFSVLCDHHLCLILEHPHHPERRPHTHQQSPPFSLLPWLVATTLLFSASIDLSVPIISKIRLDKKKKINLVFFHTILRKNPSKLFGHPTNGILHCVTFGFWLLSCNMMFSRFTHVVADISTSFLCV